MFREITSSFGKPDIDLFASRSNTKCKSYVSWKKDSDSIAVDAFTISWENYHFYASPPLSVILKSLQKIRNDRACGIMVVPEWPVQPWYPLFCALLITKPLRFLAKDNLIFSSSQTDPFWSGTTLVAGILSANRSN